MRHRQLPNDREHRGAGAARARLLLWLVLPVCGLSCTPSHANKVGLPARHSVKAEQLFVLSDFKLAKDHPLMKDLIELRKQVSESLALPLGSKQVVVYLFTNELEYRQYWNATYPGYPERRAYFVQTPDRELAVYTYWGERIREDLRHEYTHGLLHAGLESVPLWLDEGLAEYFEVAGPTAGQVNPEYSQMLATALQNGWRPDMRRLEQIDKVENMKRADYREAWAWMHFLLHSSPDTKQVLLSYLQDLRTNPNPDPLSERLKTEIPQIEERLLSHVSTLNTFGSGGVAIPASGVRPARGTAVLP